VNIYFRYLHLHSHHIFTNILHSFCGYYLLFAIHMMSFCAYFSLFGILWAYFNDFKNNLDIFFVFWAFFFNFILSPNVLKVYCGH
jgi:hypothetical protein